MSLPSFLKDRRFLHEIDNLKIKQQFVKITVLDWNENSIQQIQGICISGNLNIDGSSSLRRTANLTVLVKDIVDNLTNIDSLFALNKKCKIEIGIKNTVSEYSFINNNTTRVINYQELYGDIIWFPVGIFVMFNPSISYGLDGLTISMNLKDKMCLLNGDVAGIIPASVNFSWQDEQVDQDNNSVYKKYVLIYNIIKELVNHWGNEKLSNIIISEVPLKIKKAMQWTSSDNIYLVQKPNSSQYYLSYSRQSAGDIQFGQNDIIGYIYTDFIYPPSIQLASNPGDTVTSILDKIIEVLGNYEYFYDIQGKFIFQQQRNFLNMSYTAYWQKENTEEYDIPIQEYSSNLYALSPSVYNFNESQLIINYNPSLNYNNIKNDYVVWGSKKIGSSQRIYRYHLAIDKKPQIGQIHYITLRQDIYGNYRAKIDSEGIERISTDWREEIYYQALQSQKLGLDENTELNNTYSAYYAELIQEFPKIFDLNGSRTANGWKIDIVNNPQAIEYYLDFIDSQSQLGKYSINNIGRRSKVVNGSNEKINCTFEPIIPDIVYVNAEEMGLTEEQYIEYIQSLNNYGQNWTQISSSMYSNLITATVPNSCFEKIKDLLYQHTNMADTISFSLLPIYYLQPNTIISLYNKQVNIDGNYVIKSISLPLDINSTMSISAYKVLNKI